MGQGFVLVFVGVSVMIGQSIVLMVMMKAVVAVFVEVERPGVGMAV